MRDITYTGDLVVHLHLRISLVFERLDLLVDLRFLIVFFAHKLDDLVVNTIKLSATALLRFIYIGEHLLCLALEASDVAVHVVVLVLRLDFGRRGRAVVVVVVDERRGLSERERISICAQTTCGKEVIVVVGCYGCG